MSVIFKLGQVAYTPKCKCYFGNFIDDTSYEKMYGKLNYPHCLATTTALRPNQSKVVEA